MRPRSLMQNKQTQSQQKYILFVYFGCSFPPAFVINLPLTGLGQLFDLFLEVDTDFLVLLLQDVCGLFGFQMNFVQQFAQLQQFDVTVAVDGELTFGTAFSLFQTFGHLNDLNAKIGLFAFNLYIWKC